MICLYCHTFDESAEQRVGLTAYHWDGEGDNPNDPGIMCDECYSEYEAHWSAMWAEYRASIGYY